jgi:hypothetical protein
VQAENRKTVWIGQPAYTENLLKKIEMEHCKPVSTPIIASSKLETAKDDEVPIPLVNALLKIAG